MLKKTAQTLLLFVIGMNVCHGMEKEEPPKGFINKCCRVKNIIFKKKGKRNNDLNAITITSIFYNTNGMLIKEFEKMSQAETTSETESLGLDIETINQITLCKINDCNQLNPNNGVKAKLYYDHFFIKQAAEKLLGIHTFPAEVRKIIALYSYEIANQSLVYSFPSEKVVEGMVSYMYSHNYPERENFVFKVNEMTIKTVRWDICANAPTEGIRLNPRFLSQIDQVFSSEVFLAEAPGKFHFNYTESQKNKRKVLVDTFPFLIQGFDDICGWPVDLSTSSIRLAPLTLKIQEVGKRHYIQANPENSVLQIIKK